MKPRLLLIPPDTKNKKAIIWLFNTAIHALNLKQVNVGENDSEKYETIRISDLDFNTIICRSDFSDYNLNKLSSSITKEGVFLLEGKEDELYTAFYLINSLQEYASPELDSIGRYKYEASYQKKFNSVEINFVSLLFERYFTKFCPQLLGNRQFEKSRLFLSHDIDSLYGEFLQDGLAAFKNGRLDIIASIIVKAFIAQPGWFNIDKILKIENDYDLKSTFFWIVNKGRVNKAITNADYSFQSKKVQEALQMIQRNGSTLGLHKSVSSESFDDELRKFDLPVTINRNHYLRLQLPEHYDLVEASALKMDFSLGFAEAPGFRNSLAIPFIPFNCKKGEAYNFLEVPLNIMDGTFQKYLKVSPETASENMIRFIEQNKTNSVISVLWHNHFFTSYRFKDYFKPYVDLLEYLKDKQYGFVDPKTLFDSYYFKK